jgi:hypothetical protein
VKLVSPVFLRYIIHPFRLFFGRKGLRKVRHAEKRRTTSAFPSNHPSRWKCRATILFGSLVLLFSACRTFLSTAQVPSWQKREQPEQRPRRHTSHGESGHSGRRVIVGFARPPRPSRQTILRDGSAARQYSLVASFSSSLTGAAGAETASPYEPWRVRPFGTTCDAAAASCCLTEWRDPTAVGFARPPRPSRQTILRDGSAARQYSLVESGHSGRRVMPPQLPAA